MRIFYSLEAFYPHISGVTIVTDRLASYFAEQGNETFVITASDKGDFLIEKNPKGYTVIRFKSYPSVVRKKIRISPFPKIATLKLFKKFSPDIIHLQDPVFVSQVLSEEALKRKIPVIATQHSSLAFPLSYLGLPKVVSEWAEKIIAKTLVHFYNKHCKLIITPSNFIKSEVLNWGVKIPVEVVSNGIDLELFKKGKVSLEFLKKYYLEDFISKPIVLYSGRIDKDKNLEILIKAIPLVLKEKEVNFLFLGDGDIKSDLEREVKLMGIENNVRFIGPLQPSNSDLSKFYQLASLFVIPSFIEGQSMVTMEAMASGLAVIASNGGALKELLKDNENGFLVNPFSEKEFAEKILAVLNDEKLRKRMSQKSLELIKPHNISNTYKKFEEIYQQFV